MKAEQRKQTNRMIERFIQGLLIVILVILTIFMMLDVEKIQGNARVINYAGIIRGATQREIKLEISGNKNDNLIRYLDDIFDGLIHGGGKYQLTKLDDQKYQKKLAELNTAWDELKKEIQTVRENGYENTNIIEMSENYFYLADETVTAAEDYSQHCASQLDRIEKGLIIAITLIVFVIIRESISAVFLMKRNRELNKLAYIDLHTGLPNRSRVEELIVEYNYFDKQTAMIVFDLNDLKEVNDSLGHIAGDTLIMNFAHIIRTSIPDRHFVGRYGGDEFISLLSDITEDEVKEIIKKVQDEAKRYNEFSKQIRIEFAYGYALSTNYQEANLKVLLNQADKNMYECKNRMKQAKKENPSNK